MKTNTIIQGDALEELKKLPDESINCCMTSPPYWALRDYGVEGQLGLEPTFDLYIKHLCDIFDEVKRVLRKDGTCWVNVGDTYYGGGGSAGHTEETKNLGYKTLSMGAVAHKWERPSREAFKQAGIKGKCLICGKECYGDFCSRECLNKKGNDFRSQNRIMPDKSLCNIPARFSIEMQNRGWILRNVIIWHKPNCMPSSVKDRFTVDFEYLFFFVKSKKYWFETQLEPIAESSLKDPRLDNGREQHIGKSASGIYQCSGTTINSRGRNKRAVWKITTKPFKEAHFATFPEALVETPLKAGCPEFVCNKCGKARETIDIKIGTKQVPPFGGVKQSGGDNPTYSGNTEQNIYRKELSNCGCNEGFSSGTVLDPFFGAGTCGLVALKQNKQFIGIELNPKYIEIAEKRLKPFLEQTKLFMDFMDNDRQQK